LRKIESKTVAAFSIISVYMIFCIFLMYKFLILGAITVVLSMIIGVVLIVMLNRPKKENVECEIVYEAIVIDS